MSASASPLSSGAHLDALVGSRPLVLAGGPQLRVVESGALGLFLALVRSGEVCGPRRFLCQIGVGQPLVAPPGVLPEGHCLVGVPIRRAVLREVLPSPGWSDERIRRGELAPLFEQWVDLLTGWLSGLPAARIPVRLGTSAQVELEQGQDLSAEHRRVIWVRVLAGRLELLADEQHTLQPGDPALPITGGLFLRARSAASVEVFTTDAAPSLEDLWGGLTALERVVLARVHGANQREEALEIERLGSSAKLEAQRARAAFGELVAILEPTQAAPPEGPPLLAAARLIGRDLGVEVRAPGRSEDRTRHADPLEAMARASHLRLRNVRLSPAWWRRDCGPLLAWEVEGEQRRPLALLRRAGRYESIDPASGARRRVDPRLAQGLEPIAVTFYRPLSGRRLELVDMLRFASRGRLGDLLMVLGVGVAATLLGMLVPIGTAVLMDNAIPDADRRLMIELGMGLAAAAFGQAVFRLSERIVLLRLGLGAEAETQAALWDRLLRLRPSFFRRYSSGDLQSRVMAVSGAGREITGNVTTTLFSSFLALLNLGLLCYFSPRLSLLAVAVGAAVVLVTLLVGQRFRRTLTALLDLDGRLFGLQIQLIQAVGKLRVAGAEVRAFTHWLRTYTEQLRLLGRALRLSEISAVFNLLVLPLSTALLFLFAVDLLRPSHGAPSAGDLTLGTFLAFSAAFGTFLAGMTSLSDAVVSFLDASAQARRIDPILKELPEVDETKADPGSLSGRIEISNVDFRYLADGPNVLHGVSLRAEPGEFVALVGPSGGGKSTLLRLLLGFETPSSGTVAYDGQDLSTLDVLAVRRQLGVVLQHGRVSSGSIFENIGSGALLTLDEAWAAAEDAGFADEVREMPMGLHTIVSEGGSNLSGGQRQRLLIARALARRPRLVLLDEATSALDNRTQAVVSESLQRLRVTRIVVAHRLSTIRLADRICVIDAGRVTEEGSFEALMAAGGLFARMMARQIA